MFLLAENSDDWYTCQFCVSKFTSRDEWTSHTFGHFKRKKCSDCDTRLFQICDDWFELHTITNCQNSIQIHTHPDEHIENNDQLVDVLEVKQEPVVAKELQYNVENDVEQIAFEEIFAADFNAKSDDDNSSNTFSMDTSSFGVDFNNGKSQCTFEVTNIREVKKHPDRSQSHLKKNLRDPNSCKHCGRKFMLFKCLVKHIKQCATKKQKREYFRAHPHRPASDFICGLCVNGKVLKTFPSLIHHMNEVHSKNASYKCRICGESYSTRYYLQKHTIKHKDVLDAGSGAVSEIMDDSDQGLMEKQKYRRKTENPIAAVFTCSKCGRQFDKPHLLEKHKSSQHMADGRFHCIKCRRYYPNKYVKT